MKKFKDIKVFIGIGGIIAFMLFAMGIDSIIDAGFFGFIKGIMICISIGAIAGFIAQIVYWTMQKTSPKTLKKIKDYLEDDGPAFYEED